MGTILNAHLSGSGGNPLALVAGDGAFQGLPALLRTEMAQGIRAAFRFGLGAVALGIPISLLVPHLSPVPPEGRTDAAGTRSVATLD
jgi:hypothetical protein